MKKEFISLYNSESDALFRYLLIRTSSREVSLDLSQESFLRLWNTISSGKEISNLRAFLFTIARNLIIDWYRKKKSVSLEALGESADGESSDVLDRLIVEGSSQEIAELQADGRMVIEKIKELDEPYQQAVYLRFVEDMKPQEIAMILEESVNVISVRISRGLEKLRKIAGDKE